MAESVHCKECQIEVDPAHIFECLKCDGPMCHSCWKKLGEKFCTACSASATNISLDGSYWDRTDRIKAMGQTPQCCGGAMSAEDDHGRFLCFSCGRRASL